MRKIFFKIILDKHNYFKYIISMKKYFIHIILVFSTFSILFAGEGVRYSVLGINSDSDNVTISWHTSVEDNLKETCIERRTVNGVFTEIGKLSATGDNSSYIFIDENAFKIEDGVYMYRLKFVYSDGRVAEYSREFTVTHLTSVGKRTWGSIKALFR